MENTEFMATMNQLEEMSKASGNQLQYADMRQLFEGKELTGSQIDMLWKQLDQRHIMVFHIDEEDVLFKGVDFNKTVRIPGAGEAPDKKPRKGLFRRR